MLALILLLPAATEAGQYLDLTYATDGESVTITAYTGPGGPVDIPGAINGLPVTRIGANAFASRYYVTVVTIPNSVTNIGDGAFAECELTHITLPNSVTSIGDGAFAGSHLAHLTIPDSVTSIGANLFRRSGLQSITIPHSVTWIGDGAFAECFGLTNITIPNSVTSIGDEAFDSCRVVDMVIPESVTHLGNLAFFSGGMRTVSIPNSLTTLGREVFAFCNGLTHVTVPESVTSIGSGAFAYCSHLTAVTLGNRVTHIEDEAFNQCTALTTFTIPESVERVGGSAFANCTHLTRITIPNRVETIDDSAFEHCDRLAAVTLGSGVKSLAGDAFSYCAPLSVTIADGTPAIGSGWFENCMSLKSITLPDSVTNIEDNAFRGCNRLAEINLSDRITRVGEQAFAYCDHLTTVRLPNSVTFLGQGAFFGCPGLTQVDIGTGLTSIGNETFLGCSRLNNFRVPLGITSVGNSAFAYCSGLSAMYFEGNAPTPGVYVFGDAARDLTIYYLVGTRGWGPTFAGRPTMIYPLGVLGPMPKMMMALEGTAATLSARIGGVPPLAFQWYFNGQPIAGETNPVYRLSSVTATQAGDYAVIAQNALGMVTNGPVTLGVNNVMPTNFLGLVVSGEHDPSTRIEFATNLSGPWTLLAGPRLAENPNAVIDLTDTASGQRFYRATPAVRLEARRWPGWTFAGPSGAAYRIEYVTAATGFGNWQFLTNLTLPESPYLFIDTTATNDGLRYYRTTPLP